MKVVRSRGIGPHSDGNTHFKCTLDTTDGILLYLLRFLHDPCGDSRTIAGDDIKTSFERWYEEDALLSHCLYHLFILMQICAMLNRADSAVDRIADALDTVCMCGYWLAHFASFLNYNPQFLRGELHRSRLLIGCQYSASRQHFDEVGTCLQLFACSFAYFISSIRFPIHPLI